MVILICKSLYAAASNFFKVYQKSASLSGILASYVDTCQVSVIGVLINNPGSVDSGRVKFDRFNSLQSGLSEALCKSFTAPLVTQ